jgi:hypothetical protein
MEYGCWLGEQSTQPGSLPRRLLKLLQRPPVNGQGMQRGLQAGAHLLVEDYMWLCQLQWVSRGTTPPSLGFSSPGEDFRWLGESLVSTLEFTSEASSGSLRKEKCEAIDPHHGYGARDARGGGRGAQGGDTGRGGRGMAAVPRGFDRLLAVGFAEGSGAQPCRAGRGWNVPA